jgi:hypothetical protein
MESMDNALPVHTVVCLETKNSSGISHQVVQGAEKIPLLRIHIFRDQLMIGSGRQENQFNLLAKLARQVRLIRLERPSHPLNIDTLTTYALKHIIDQQ